jgi:hypothetical protein
MDEATRITLRATGRPSIRKVPEMTGTEPNRYDPTEAELTRSRGTLSRVPREDLSATAFAHIAGRLDGIAMPNTDVDQSIREMRAVLAVYDELRKQSKAAGS